ncbi:uncharacterized protein LOC132578319 [Heteronotia binoei]|uniref:uncharacterized protein LOC132578319 n=1 Tax=Heteronotia binoei TaxID=13085 RepID=UPI002930FC9D|nr:uncharacterized protein LOC132578319 [Heteronotia binoei]
MESRILLVLGFAMAASALSPTQEDISYEEAVSLAINLYNQEPETAWAFRLLKAKPQPEWDPSIQSLQELEFTVQETTCPPSKHLNLDRCDFKDDGVVKECYGTIFSEQGAPVIQYLCETEGEGHIRVRRGIRKVIRKVKKGIMRMLPGGGSPIAGGNQGEAEYIGGDRELKTVHPQTPTEAGTMASRMLLVLGFAMAAAALSPTQEEVSYEEAVSLAVDLYNQESETAWGFRLLKAKPHPKWDPSIRFLQEMEFTIQETTCPPSEQLNLDKCDFKDNGLVKECYGTIFSEQGTPVVGYLCETAGKRRSRVRRNVRKVTIKIKDQEHDCTCTPKLPPGGGSSIANVPSGGGHIE